MGTRTVWTGVENLAPTGTRSRHHPARSESLFRVSYPGPQIEVGKGKGKVLPLQAQLWPRGWVGL